MPDDTDEKKSLLRVVVVGKKKKKKKIEKRWRNTLKYSMRTAPITNKFCLYRSLIIIKYRFDLAVIVMVMDCLSIKFKGLLTLAEIRLSRDSNAKSDGSSRRYIIYYYIYCCCVRSSSNVVVSRM